jgi:hypothetical protein
VSFVSGTLIEGWTTPWMLALWVGFATALTGSLRWVIDRTWIAVAFGMIGGPLAYWSGAKLGAIELGALPRSFVLIGLGWGAAMAVLSLAVQKLTAPTRREAYA